MIVHGPISAPRHISMDEVSRPSAESSTMARAKDRKLDIVDQCRFLSSSSKASDCSRK